MPHQHNCGSFIHEESIYSQTVVGNKIVDHSDVAGASPIGAAPATSSLSGFNGLGKGIRKARQETFKFGDLFYLILEVWG